MLRGVGVIHSGNLCTEVFLPTNEEEIAVCNLASVNLARHVREDGEIDWIKLAETVKIAVRGLDNAIDVNLYPSERARRSNLLNRPIGLGVMGFAELLAMKGIPYDSPEAVELADRLLEFISYHAIMASHELSRERGSFPRFKESEWAKGRLPLDTLEDLERERGVPVEVDRKTRLDWESLRAKVREGMRNGTVMAIAPTATISIIAGTSPGLDPYFSNIFSRQTLSGKFIDVNRYLMNELKTLGLWEKVKEKLVEEQGDLSRIEGLPDDIKRKYPTAFQISPFTLIDIAAVAQKWVDMAISRTLYLVASRPSDIAEVYLYAWRKGLKSTYYCFVRPRMHAEPYTVDVNKTERRPLWLIETQKEVEALQACRRCEGCD
jgi:ribonucleoside-diphosphate reductase alpha chain